MGTWARPGVFRSSSCHKIPSFPSTDSRVTHQPPMHPLLLITRCHPPQEAWARDCGSEAEAGREQSLASQGSTEKHVVLDASTSCSDKMPQNSKEGRLLWAPFQRVWSAVA